jgi:hypothetical protein
MKIKKTKNLAFVSPKNKPTRMAYANKQEKLMLGLVLGLGAILMLAVMSLVAWIIML